MAKLKVRKRPLDSEAMRFLPTEQQRMDDLAEWGASLTFSQGVWKVRTYHGDWAQINPGDWVIRDADGMFYPCSAIVFDKTYDVVG